MKFKERGFSLVEVLITGFIASIVFLAMLSLYVTSLRDATLSRQRLLGTIEAENTLAEIEAHPYGDPPPHDWGNQSRENFHEEDIAIVISGKESQAKVARLITSQNGSFFGRNQKSEDVVTIRIRWWEPTSQGHPDEMVEITRQVAVVREPDMVTERVMR